LVISKTPPKKRGFLFHLIFIDMKKIVKLTENDLNRIVKKVLNENEKVYGHQDIRGLYDKLSDDEDVYLDDSSGNLSGHILPKKDYVANMLKRAVENQDWSLVNRAISYLKIKF
jgi:hypothetical protein